MFTAVRGTKAEPLDADLEVDDLLCPPVRR
jgi:hypothetical protein